MKMTAMTSSAERKAWYCRVIVELGQHLARKAKAWSGGAQRTAVRLLSDDGQFLTLAGSEGDFPDSFLQTKIFDRSADSAYNHALKQGVSYLVEDTQELNQHLHFLEVPPRAAAHMAVLIRNGSRVTGVLSVDFDVAHRAQCNEPLLRKLEELSAVYGRYFEKFRSEKLWAELETVLPAENVVLSGETFQQCLDLAGHALNLKTGSLFLRKRETGRYAREANLNEPDQQDAACEYEFDEGRTGWVVKNKKPLRLFDCEDLREMALVKPRIRQTSKKDCWARGKEKLAYLAVPILDRNDVYGVLRFLRKTRLPSTGELTAQHVGFTAIDEQIATAIASRLGRWIGQQEDQCRREALSRLMQAALQAPCWQQLCNDMHGVFQKILGKCSLVVREVNGFAAPSGQVNPVLALLYQSNDLLCSPPFLQHHEEIEGRVWAEQKELFFPDTLHAPNGEGEVPPATTWQRTQSRCSFTVPLKRLIKENNDPAIWGLQTHLGHINPDNDVVGTLTVHRNDSHSLLEADLDFIRQTAGVLSAAFQRLAKAEENRIKDSVTESVLEFLHAGNAPAFGKNLLLRVCRAVVQELKTSGFVWETTQNSTIYRALPLSDDGAHALRDVPRSLVAQHLGEKTFVVVSEPLEDQRLEFLFSHLPSQEQARLRGGQQAAFCLARTDHLRLLQPGLFFFVAEPPNRISCSRFETIVKILTTMLAWPRTKMILRTEVTC